MVTIELRHGRWPNWLCNIYNFWVQSTDCVEDFPTWCHKTCNLSFDNSNVSVFYVSADEHVVFDLIVRWS